MPVPATGPGPYGGTPRCAGQSGGSKAPKVNRLGRESVLVGRNGVPRRRASPRPPAQEAPPQKFNTLEQRLSLIEDDGGGPVPVILPSANVLVEEARVEASVMLSSRTSVHT